MNRRDFVQAVVALSVTQLLGACCLTRRCVSVPDIPEERIVVDGHSHTFNAADLPVDGFIEYVALSGVNIPGVNTLIAILVQAIADVGAPGFEEERERLDILLGAKARIAKVRDQWILEDKERERRYQSAINAAIDKIIGKIRSKAASPSEEEFIREFYEELGVAKDFKGRADWHAKATKGVGVIPRYIIWGFKLLRYRYQQVEDIQGTYSRIDLFTPALIDFDLWFVGHGTQPKASTLRHARVRIDDQMKLMQRITRWSRGNVHPYIAYDPRRDVESDGQALEWVRHAITSQGAIGVKLYPPMGFVAFGNAGLSFCNSADKKLGEKLDQVLLNLYGYCQEAEIPVIAHAADTNYNGQCKPYMGRAHPRYWRRVLERFPNLRLNLAHFGTHELPGGTWSQVMRELMISYEHVYADLSHVEEIDDPQYAKDFFTRLDAFFGANPNDRKRLQQRVLYGSDWIMLAKENVGDHYFNQLVSAYGSHFGDAARDWFVGHNTVRFLGLADGKNRYRLKQFYKTWNMPDPNWMAKLEDPA